MAQTYLNRKQELFCKFVAEGASNAEAYELAGYEPSSANACTMAGKPLIKSRIAELKQAHAKRNHEFAVLANQAKKAGEALEGDPVAAIDRNIEWTMQRLMDEMGANVRFAQIAGEFRAANECLRMMGEALNLFEDAKAKKNEGNRSPAQNTLAFISEVTNVLAPAGRDGEPEGDNPLRPRLPRARDPEPVE